MVRRAIEQRAGDADASVHALLYSAAGHCREILEVALQRVSEHEGIAPPETQMSE